MNIKDWLVEYDQYAANDDIPSLFLKFYGDPKTLREVAKFFYVSFPLFMLGDNLGKAMYELEARASLWHLAERRVAPKAMLPYMKYDDHIEDRLQCLADFDDEFKITLEEWIREWHK